MQIQETFQETIQGEGALAGSLVAFIRIYGCPIGCWFCDTGYSELDGDFPVPHRNRSVNSLLEELKSPRVVLSGGEPMAHPQLLKLNRSLEGRRKSVSIETSGAYWQELPDSVWVTLSPKEHLFPNSDHANVDERFWQRADEIKLVIADGTELEWYWEKLKSVRDRCFFQPEWFHKETSVPRALDALKRMPEARLSVQLHKYLNLD